MDRSAYWWWVCVVCLGGIVCGGSDVALAISGRACAAIGRRESQSWRAIEIRDGRLRVEAEEACLQNILEEIGRRSGIRIVLDASVDETVSMLVYDTPLDEGIRRLIGHRDFVLLYHPPGVLAEIRLLGRSDRARTWRTARELGQANGPEKDGDGRVAMLSDALGGWDARAREQAIWALDEIGGDRVLEVLTKALREDGDQYVRGSAVGALARIRSPSIPLVLVEALNDSAPWVRDRAVSALATVGGSETIKALTQVLLEDEDVVVREKAVEALGQLGSKEVMESLRMALQDKEPSVRETVMRILEKGVTVGK